MRWRLHWGEAREAIAKANQQDIEEAVGKGLSPAKVDRLRLSDKVAELMEGLREIALLPDPVGKSPACGPAPTG